MAAPRAYWKGRLRLSLVTVGVAMYAATSRSSRLALHQLHEPSGKRVRYEKVVPEIGPVDSDEIVKGYEYQKGSYVVLEPEDLDAIKLESRQTIDLVQFVKHHEIDPRFYDRPYYLTPDGPGAEEGFGVIRDALRDTERIGLGQMTMRGAEYLVALIPCGRGLLLETLRFADEVRDSESVFDEIPEIEVDDEMRELAEELIDRKTAPFDPGSFHDSYADAVRTLIEEKLKGKKVVHTGEEARERARGGNVVDLMDALKKSVGESKGKGKGKKQGKKSARSSSGGQRKRKAG